MKRKVFEQIVSLLISGALGSIIGFLVQSERTATAMVPNAVFVGPSIATVFLFIILISLGVIILIRQSAARVVAGTQVVFGSGMLLGAPEAFWNGLFVVSLLALVGFQLTFRLRDWTHERSGGRSLLARSRTLASSAVKDDGSPAPYARREAPLALRASSCAVPMPRAPVGGLGASQRLGGRKKRPRGNGGLASKAFS
jgi:hypothetical protein